MSAPLPRRQRIAAYGLAVQSTKVLLVREPQSGMWWLPGGGIDYGEAPAEGLAREFREEVGATVVGTRLVDVVSDVCTLSAEQVELHSVRIVYEIQLGAHCELRPELDGSTVAPRWIPLSDVDRLPMPPWLESWLPRYSSSLS